MKALKTHSIRILETEPVRKSCVIVFHDRTDLLRERDRFYKPWWHFRRSYLWPVCKHDPSSCFLFILRAKPTRASRLNSWSCSKLVPDWFGVYLTNYFISLTEWNSQVPSRSPSDYINYLWYQSTRLLVMPDSPVCVCLFTSLYFRDINMTKPAFRETSSKVKMIQDWVSLSYVLIYTRGVFGCHCNHLSFWAMKEILAYWAVYTV